MIVQLLSGFKVKASCWATKMFFNERYSFCSYFCLKEVQFLDFINLLD